MREQRNDFVFGIGIVIVRKYNRLAFSLDIFDNPADMCESDDLSSCFELPIWNFFLLIELSNYTSSMAPKIEILLAGEI